MHIHYHHGIDWECPVLGSCENCGFVTFPVFRLWLGAISSKGTTKGTFLIYRTSLAAQRHMLVLEKCWWSKKKIALKKTLWLWMFFLSSNPSKPFTRQFHVHSHGLMAGSAMSGTNSAIRSNLKFSISATDTERRTGGARSQSTAARSTSSAFQPKTYLYFTYSQMKSFGVKILKG